MLNQLIIFFTFFAFVESAYAVGTTVAVYFGLTAAGALTATGVAVALAVNFALSYVVSQILAPNLNPNQQDNGVRIQVPPDTTTSIPVVYGDAYLGGKFVDAVLCSEGEQAGLVMYYVMAVSCISPNGTFTFDTTEMYYGDRKITFDNVNTTRVASLTDGAGNVDTSINPGLGLLFINLYRSDYAGNVTPLNGGPLPWASGTIFSMGANSGINPAQQWPSTGRRMNGLAFAIVRMTYSREAGTTQLQPITFKCKQTLNSQAVAKPGDVWYDYMNSEIYGGAVNYAYIDTNSATALNTYSDQLITFDDYDGNPQTQPRYRINGVIDPSKPFLENVDQILNACDSWMQYKATTGQWAIVVNKAESPSYAFNDSNIIGSISVGSIDITQIPNKIQGRFPDSQNRDQYNYVNLETPNALLYPNEPVNKLDINYDLVNNSVQALYLANRVLEQAREDLLVTIDTTYDGIQVDAGDVVSVTNTAYGWNNKLFRAMQVKEIVNETGLTAQIQLTEYNADVYDDKEITEYTPPPNSNITSPYYFPALPAPTIINAQASATVPEFTIRVVIPSGYRILQVDLYYQVATSPAGLTEAGWKLGPNQRTINSQAFIGGTNVDFVLTGIPATPAGYNYYFSYILVNEVSQSSRSAYVSYVWSPNPTGLQGPRSSSGFIYYSTASQTAPPAPTASGFNFTTGQFTTLTAGWSTTFTAPDPVTNPFTQNGSKFWAVRYSVSEVTYGGTQTVDISAVFNWQNLNGLVTFTNTQSPSGVTFIDGGNITTDTITVNRLKSNTQGTYNGGTFQLGTGATVSGIFGTAAFTGTSGVWGLIVANNSPTGAIVGVSTSTSSGPGGLFGNAYNTAYNSFRTTVVAADNNYGLVANAPIWGTQGIVAQSGYAFYAGAGGYGPFTGIHDALIPNGTELTVGDIVVDTNVIYKKNISDVISVVAYSNEPNQKGVLGVISSETALDNIPATLAIQVTNPESGLSETVVNPEYANVLQENQVITINAVGEGQINVCGEGGDISIGDLIVTSSMPGKGMKQADDIIRSYTVAKARENVTFSTSTEIKMIGCTYISG